MDDFEKIEYATKAYKTYNDLFLDFGLLLMEVKQSKAWKKAGGHITFFNDFLKEYGIRKADADRAMRIATLFGDKIRTLGLYGITPAKLMLIYRVHKLIKDNEDEWLRKADLLTEADLRDEIRKLKGLNDSLECPHQKIKLYGLCECGKWIKMEDELHQCLS